MQGITVDKTLNGYYVKAPGFIINVSADDFGGVCVSYSGKIPHKLKKMLEKNKHLFVTVDLAKKLISNELMRL